MSPFLPGVTPRAAPAASAAARNTRITSVARTALDPSLTTSVRRNCSYFAEKRSSADHAFRAVPDAGAKRAIRRREPERTIEPGDDVVGRTATRAEQVVGPLGRIAVEDDDQIGALPARPRTGPRDELALRAIRPRRPAHVLGV